MPIYETEKLDPENLSTESLKLSDYLHNRILGQPRAIRQFVQCYQAFLAGMSRPDRPLGTYLFLGPTGTGKTHLARTTAEFLYGKSDCMTRIDCAEYQHSHEISKLIGSPAGYVGFKEGARLSQKEIDKFKTNGHKDKPSIILFDEIEKADPALFDILLGVLDVGRITLGSGETTDFTNSIIFCTSNLGSAATKNLILASGIGFERPKMNAVELDEKIYQKSKKAVEKHFRPEFVNRFDRLIVFRSLSKDTLRLILENEIFNVRRRLDRTRFRGWEVGTPLPDERSIDLKVSEASKEFLLSEGTSELYGARELNKAIERFLAQPIASFIVCQELKHRDILVVDYVAGAKDLEFSRRRR